MSLRNYIIVILYVFSAFYAHAQVIKADIIATGLTCSMCSNAINKQFKSIPELDSVIVDLNNNSFMVYVNPKKVVSPRILKERVEKAGFFVGSMTVTMHFDQVDISRGKRVEKDGIFLIIVEDVPTVLDGEVSLKILDQGYVTQKEFKKFSKSFSGIPSYIQGDENDYHVIKKM